MTREGHSLCRYVRREAEGTAERLRQAQRRDTGLPFNSTVIEAPASHGTGPQSAAAAYAAASEGGAGGGTSGNAASISSFAAADYDRAAMYAAASNDASGGYSGATRGEGGDGESERIGFGSEGGLLRR
jgi:hypothetical protein